MFARTLLAMIAMLPWSAVSCLAASGSTAVVVQGHEVGVFLRSDGGVSGPVLDSMKVELDAVLNQAGFHFKWWTGRSTGPVEAEELIVVDLRGTCRVPQRPGLRRAVSFELELASTFVVGSEILPFSSLDCTTFNDLMSEPLWHMDASIRDFVYGRALARVLAHEFYHVLVRTHKHTSKGVAKKAHSAEDLLSERFDFDSVALAQLRQVHRVAPLAAQNQTGSEGAPIVPAEPAVVSAESPSGRQ